MDSSSLHTENESSLAIYSIPRTVMVVRKTLETTFGFALQSYVFQRRGRGFTEQLTYVDYVRDKSPAAIAGIKRGDVVLSVNGLSVIGETHTSLVTLMNSFLKMKLVLIYQNITKIIQLSARSIQLAYILREKEILLRIIELDEKKLMKRGNNDETGTSEGHEQSPGSERSQGAIVKEYDWFRFERMLFRGFLSNQKTAYYLAVRLTSSGPPPAAPPKPGTLSYKYDKFISQWPKIQAIHRMVVDGSRWCFSDIKTYYYARKSLRSGKRLNELSFSDLETLVQTPTEGPKLLVVLTLLPLPFTVYIIGFAMIFFPRFVLTRHFWTDTQRKDFFLKDVEKSMELASQSETTFKKRLIDSSNHTVDNLSYNDLITLGRFHGYLPLPFNLHKRLKDRAIYLKQLDNQLHAQLNGLTSQQLYFHMYIRRLTYNNLSDGEIRAKLSKWLSFSSNLTDTNYLVAPFYYNK